MGETKRQDGTCKEKRRNLSGGKKKTFATDESSVGSEEESSRKEVNLRSRSTTEPLCSCVSITLITSWKTRIDGESLKTLAAQEIRCHAKIVRNRRRPSVSGRQAARGFGASMLPA
jgi:hypothetical protein